MGNKKQTFNIPMSKKFKNSFKKLGEKIGENHILFIVYLIFHSKIQIIDFRKIYVCAKS